MGCALEPATLTLIPVQRRAAVPRNAGSRAAAPLRSTKSAPVSIAWNDPLGVDKFFNFSDTLWPMRELLL